MNKKMLIVFGVFALLIIVLVFMLYYINKDSVNVTPSTNTTVPKSAVTFSNIFSIAAKII